MLSVEATEVNGRPRGRARAAPVLVQGRTATLDRRACLAIGLISFNEFLALNLIVPFVRDMVIDVGVPADSAGLAAATMTGCYGLGVVASARMWGATSDRYGRRGVLLASAVASAASTALLGSATTFPACVAVRFCGGLCNGLWCVLKSAVADLVTDTKGQSRAFGLMQISAALGAIIGPTIGGLLAGLDAGQRRPFLLPCLLCALLQVALGCTGVALFPAQENKRKTAKGDDDDDDGGGGGGGSGTTDTLDEPPASPQKTDFVIPAHVRAALESAVDGDTIGYLPRASSAFDLEGTAMTAATTATMTPGEESSPLVGPFYSSSTSNGEEALTPEHRHREHRSLASIFTPSPTEVEEALMSPRGRNRSLASSVFTTVPKEDAVADEAAPVAGPPNQATRPLNQAIVHQRQPSYAAVSSSSSSSETTMMMRKVAPGAAKKVSPPWRWRQQPVKPLLVYVTGSEEAGDQRFKVFQESPGPKVSFALAGCLCAVAATIDEMANVSEALALTAPRDDGGAGLTEAETGAAFGAGGVLMLFFVVAGLPALERVLRGSHVHIYRCAIAALTLGAVALPLACLLPGIDPASSASSSSAPLSNARVHAPGMPIQQLAIVLALGLLNSAAATSLIAGAVLVQKAIAEDGRALGSGNGAVQQGIAAGRVLGPFFAGLSFDFAGSKIHRATVGPFLIVVFLTLLGLFLSVNFVGEGGGDPPSQDAQPAANIELVGDASPGDNAIIP